MPHTYILITKFALFHNFVVSWFDASYLENLMRIPVVNIVRNHLDTVTSYISVSEVVYDYLLLELLLDRVFEYQAWL